MGRMEVGGGSGDAGDEEEREVRGVSTLGGCEVFRLVLLKILELAPPAAWLLGGAMGGVTVCGRDVGGGGGRRERELEVGKDSPSDRGCVNLSAKPESKIVLKGSMGRMEVGGGSGDAGQQAVMGGGGGGGIMVKSGKGVVYIEGLVLAAVC